MLHLSHKSLIGQSLQGQTGSYKIISKLAHGGFGETYLAVDLEHPDQKWVVKHLKPNQNQRLNRDEFRKVKELFAKEAKHLHRLDHPQIPKLKDYFVINHRLLFLVKQDFFLVEEYIEGHELRDELRVSERLSNNQVWQILYDILTVLSFVHRQGLIHRDIKPENLIRREADGRLFLVDFGGVKDMTESTRTRSVMVPRSEPYTPMEQKMGFPKFATDIYSVGMIGIEALTGIHPDVHQKYITIDDQTKKVIWRNYAKEVSHELADIIDIMVDPQWENRYNTATQALEALEKIAPLEKIANPQPVQRNVPRIDFGLSNEPEQTLFDLVTTLLILPEIYKISLITEPDTSNNPPTPNPHIPKQILVVTGVAIAIIVTYLYWRSHPPEDSVSPAEENLTIPYVDKDKNMGFKIKYSDKWIENHNQLLDGEKVKFSRSDEYKKDICPLEISVNIADLGQVYSLEKYKKIVIKQINQDHLNTLEKTDEHPQLSGYEAYQITYTRKEDKCTFKKFERGTLYNKKNYYIIYQAQAQEYQKFWPVVEKIIASFKIKEN